MQYSYIEYIEYIDKPVKIYYTNYIESNMRNDNTNM